MCQEYPSEAPYLERKELRLLRESAENTSRRFSAEARASQPPQGLIPRYDVARLITSSIPMSLSFTNPGSRTGRTTDLESCVVFIVLILFDVEPPVFGTPPMRLVMAELHSYAGRQLA